MKISNNATFNMPYPVGISITFCLQNEIILILKFMVCSNSLIVDTKPIYTIPTPHVILRMISEDNLITWRKYTETIYLHYDTSICPILVFGSDEILSIWYGSCALFGKAFGLISQKRIHAGDKPQSCAVCINVFKWAR